MGDDVIMSDEITIDDMPTVALLDVPFHELSDEDAAQLVKELRERRTNAAKDRAEKKATSDVLQSKPRKASQKKLSFNPEDLLK